MSGPGDPSGTGGPGPSDDDPGVIRIERPAWDRGPDPSGQRARASWEVPEPYRLEWQRREWSTARRWPVLGIVLLVVGGALLIDQLTPISLSAIVLGALTAVFAAILVIWRARWAITPTIILAALFIPDLLGDLGILTGDGWTSLALAVAFGLVWVIGHRQGRQRRWPLWLALVLGVIGATQLSRQLPWLPDLDIFWPLAFILVGVVIVLDARLRPTAS